MITAPSTIRPKSSAPRLIRFPETPPRTIPVTVISMESGITAAVISAARMLPSNRNNTAMTSSAPSMRLVRTVAMVRSTRLVRSYTGWIEHALRQTLLNLRDSRSRGSRHRAAVFADQHDHGAEHDFLAVLRGGAGTQLLSFAHRGDVANPNRHAVAAIQHDGLRAPRCPAPGSARAPAVAARCARCSRR